MTFWANRARLPRTRILTFLLESRSSLGSEKVLSRNEGFSGGDERYD